MKNCETCGKEISKNRFCNKSCAGVWSGKNRDDTKSKICIFCNKKALSTFVMFFLAFILCAFFCVTYR